MSQPASSLGHREPDIAEEIHRAIGGPVVRQPQHQARDREDQDQAQKLDAHELHHAKINILQIPLRNDPFQEVGR